MSSTPRLRPLARGRSTALLGACAALATAALATPAQAAFIPGEPIDGPRGGTLDVGDVDMARDGGGGLVYLRQDGAITHVYLARFVDGRWLAPERVDRGVESSATGASVAAADDGRLAIVWQSGPGGQDTYGAYVAGDGSDALSAPQLLHRAAAPGLGASPAPTQPHVDMAINGRAYAVARTPGGDIVSARLGDSWTGIGQPLDATPGAAAERPRVAVSADGNAVATWAEAGKIYARRVHGTRPSTHVELASLPSFGGAAGGPADHPDIDIEDDGSYAWIVFQQQFGGGTRAIARRLVGSRFEAPAALDGGGPGLQPAIDMNGRGAGFAAAAFPPSDGVAGAFLSFDEFGDAERFDSSGGGAGAPVVGFGETRAGLVAWRRGADAVAIGRYRDRDRSLQAETVLSNPAFGGVTTGRMAASADRSGNVVVAFTQAQDAGSKRVVVASYDRLPGRPAPHSTTRWQRRSKPTLSWRGARENWGPVTFRVLIDGHEVARTAKRKIRSPVKLRSGTHRLRVYAVDRRGQVRGSKRSRPLRIDRRKPRVRVQLSGTRKRGAAVRFRVRARDRGGSKLRRTTLVFGDGQRTRKRHGVHRFRKSGQLTMRVYAWDRAKNRTVEKVRIRVAK